MMTLESVKLIPHKIFKEKQKQKHRSERENTRKFFLVEEKLNETKTNLHFIKKS